MKNNTQVLEQENIKTALLRYALPSAAGGLIGALYNIVDQIFIGHQIGMIGNAATNVVFPIVTLTNAIAMMAGVGASAGFGIRLGRKQQEEAGKIIGNGISLMFLSGILITLIVQLFLHSVLLLCGGTPDTMPLAMVYERITGFGIIFFIVSTGGSAIIRADGKPGYSLFSILSGAVLNIFLDALFMLGFGMGIEGAALATLISQVFSGLIVIFYFVFRFQSVKLKLEYFIPDLTGFFTIFKLGAGPFLNHASMVVVQILLNNALVTWGAASVYGSDIPLACAGIVAKVSSITSAIVIGIAQGAQPIISYNYGAKNYARARKTGLLAIKYVLIFSFGVFACFQLFPRQITMLFGSGTEELFEFAESYFRIFMMLICVSGMQITVGNFFTALGKPLISVLISASRQIIAFPIFLVVLPQLFGLNGVLISGPMADGICASIAILLFINEYRHLGRLDL